MIYSGRLFSEIWPRPPRIPADTHGYPRIPHQHEPRIPRGYPYEFSATSANTSFSPPHKRRHREYRDHSGRNNHHHRDHSRHLHHHRPKRRQSTPSHILPAAATTPTSVPPSPQFRTPRTVAAPEPPEPTTNVLSQCGTRATMPCVSAVHI